MNDKTVGWIKISVIYGLLASTLIAPEAFALVPQDQNNLLVKLKKDVIDVFMKNIAYIGAGSAVAAGVIVAFGSDVKKVIGNNMGYIGYIAFAPVVIGGTVTALGTTI